MAKFYTLFDYLQILHFMPKNIGDNGEIFQAAEYSCLNRQMKNIGDTGEIFDENRSKNIGVKGEIVHFFSAFLKADFH